MLTDISINNINAIPDLGMPLTLLAFLLLDSVRPLTARAPTRQLGLVGALLEGKHRKGPTVW